MTGGRPAALPNMEARQLWNSGQPTTHEKAHCTAFTLPSNGVIFVDSTNSMTLKKDAVFQPECTGTTVDNLFASSVGPTSLTALRDPFYASTLPQCYALAATTVIAYMLVIMLLITPRTFLHEGAVVLGRRGFTNGPSGSDAGIGIGGRPWLQKVATLTVAISLSIATADTFQVAEQQYDLGIMDALALQAEVENGLQLKIIRVISDTFLWLAQAQTLIRLFPRQREKIIIKWIAFALISLDALFSILNDFVYEGSARPRSFKNAVPALTYLFELALSLLYCAWVMYYAVMKRRYAFYHPQMKNICLVALLSLLALLIPVVFFVLDISQPTLASWGDYVRWVGAAAASVTVWEWVERIEALERMEKKDGILGREVFDGDEMIEVTPASDVVWERHQKKRRGGGKGSTGSKGGGGTTTGSKGISWTALTSRHSPNTGRDVEARGDVPNGTTQGQVKQAIRAMPPLWPTRPRPTATPVSRTDTASAESTVYAVRYHPISEAAPSDRDNSQALGTSHSNSSAIRPQSSSGEDTVESGKAAETDQAPRGEDTFTAEQHHTPWRALAEVNPFKTKARQPPPEVSAHAVRPQKSASSHDSLNRWDFRGRLENFAVSKADKIRDKTQPGASIEPLSVTVIPAPTRRRDLAAALRELQAAESGNRGSTHTSTPLQPGPSADLNRSQRSYESRSAQPNRSSDPYTPDDLDQHSIRQRGTISFVTTGHDRRDGDGAVDSLL
jgi:hypothetical protein